MIKLTEAYLMMSQALFPFVHGDSQEEEERALNAMQITNSVLLLLSFCRIRGYLIQLQVFRVD